MFQLHHDIRPTWPAPRRRPGAAQRERPAPSLEVQAAQHDAVAGRASHAGPVTPPPEPVGTFRSATPVPTGSSMSGPGPAPRLAPMSRDRRRRRPDHPRPGRRRRPGGLGRGREWRTPPTTSARCGCTRTGATRWSAGIDPVAVRGPDGLPAVRPGGRRSRPAGVDRQRLPVCGAADPLAVRRPRPQPRRRRRAHARATGSSTRVATSASTARSTSSSRGRPWSSPVPASRPRGCVDDHARLVDVGPDPRRAGRRPARRTCVDAAGEPLDGRPLTAYLAPAGRTADAGVVGILWDGAPLRRPAAPRRGRGAARRRPAARARDWRCAAGRSPSSRASR